MPLMHGKSKKAFEHNLKTEIKEGKPMKQSLAIAYAMKKKKKAHGGEIEMPEMEFELSHDDIVDHVMKKKYAKGGLVADEGEADELADHEINDFDYLSSGDLDDHMDNTGASDGDYIGDAQEDEDRHDIVAMVMKKRKKQHNPRPA